MERVAKKEVRRMNECERGKEIIKRMLEELEYVRKKISEIEDDIDNIIYKEQDEELRKDLNYVYMELEYLIAEIEDYCIRDCSLCPKDCDIECTVDCSDCVRFWKCLQERKVSRLDFS